MTKQERIEAEKTRLFELFENMDVNQLETAQGLISSAAFLRVSLEDLEKIINENGYIDEYQNGKDQTGHKISAAVQSYNGLCAKYTTIITKLLRIVPPERRPKVKNESIGHEVGCSDQDKQRQMERDYFAALSAGEIKNVAGSSQREVYKAFCDEWRRAHA